MNFYYVIIKSWIVGVHLKPPNQIQIENIDGFGKKKIYFLFLKIEIDEFLTKFNEMFLNCNLLIDS